MDSTLWGIICLLISLILALVFWLNNPENFKRFFIECFI